MVSQVTDFFLVSLIYNTAGQIASRILIREAYLGICQIFDGIFFRK